MKPMSIAAILGLTLALSIGTEAQKQVVSPQSSQKQIEELRQEIGRLKARLSVLEKSSGDQTFRIFKLEMANEATRVPP